MFGASAYEWAMLKFSVCAGTPACLGYSDDCKVLY